MNVNLITTDIALMNGASTDKKEWNIKQVEIAKLQFTKS